MNIIALEKIIEQMKALEALCFASHRDSDHPENCRWGVAWKAQEEARKEIEKLLPPNQ